MPAKLRPVYNVKGQVMDWDSIRFPVIPARPQTFTPMYLTQEFQPDPTTYNSMNDWMRMQGQVVSSRAPVMYAGAEGFKELPSVEVSEMTSDQAIDDYDQKFQRSYSDLAHQIAYRYPNPGLPRIRQGAIGGTWRHIKEVLGHHGSRVCFVDGLVSVYDSDKFSDALQPPLPYRGKLVHPPYAPTQTEYANGKKGIVFPRLEDGVDRKLRMNALPSHRGHYQFK
ncbi:uncharacterized protein LOC106012803 [Aplysia californica]|uniref:Uncharacterized protein LOC106012803 n=1 Tax=Aplysia californica TaxID=6500 RepID=A0ABM1A7E7_APLCA|nr:uncharacterized protein LOC106012803 [Aplysia californica]